MNPTQAALEARLNSLEGGCTTAIGLPGALAVASGQSASTLAILTLCEAGDHIVASPSLYGGSYNLLHHTIPKMGIEVTFVDDPHDLDQWRAAIRDTTKVFYGEVLPNPKNDIFDMSPYSLDLDTMQWTKHGCAPQVSKEGKESAANLQPKPRHRAASVKVTSDRLLVIGGISEQGLFLDDIVQLDLSTLEWREPPLVLGQPSHGLRHVAGCSAAGLFVFGGTTTTIFGVTPVTKLDVLQIGPPHELESKMLEEYVS